MKYERAHFFDDIDTEEKAYWLGFIYADGYVSTNTLQVHISVKDLSHLLKLGYILDTSVYPHTVHLKNKVYSAVRLQIHSPHLASTLRSMGIVAHRVKLDKVDTINHVKTWLVHHFIRGYFDGDGCISWHRQGEYSWPRVHLSGSQNLLHIFKNIMMCEIELNNNKISDHSSIKQLQWSGYPQVIGIYSWLYKDATVYLERKKDIFDKIMEKYHGQV